MVFSYIPDRMRLVPFTVELSDGRTVEGLIGYYFPKHGKYVNRFVYEGFNLLKKGRALNIPSWVVCKQLYTMWVMGGRIPSNNEVVYELACLLDNVDEHPEYDKTTVYDVTVGDYNIEDHPILAHFGIKNVDSYPEDPNIVRKMRKALHCPLPLDFGVLSPSPPAPCPLPSSTEPSQGDDSPNHLAANGRPKDTAPQWQQSRACDGGML